jgi:hypothetical protein
LKRARARTPKNVKTTHCLNAGIGSSGFGPDYRGDRRRLAAANFERSNLRFPRPEGNQYVDIRHGGSRMKTLQIVAMLLFCMFLPAFGLGNREQPLTGVVDNLLNEARSLARFRLKCLTDNAAFGALMRVSDGKLFIWGVNQ